MELQKDKIYSLVLASVFSDGISLEIAEPFLTASAGRDINFTQINSTTPVPIADLILWEEDDSSQYSLSGFSDDLHLWVFTPIQILDITDKNIIFEHTLREDDVITKKRIKLSEITKNYAKALKNYLTK